MLSRSGLNVLLIGDGTRGEMRPVQAFLQRACAADDLRSVPDGTAARMLADTEHWFPDLVVVFQNWPDEYGRSEIERLFATFPLARVVCCFGAWCESDGRTRQLWPLAVRTPARSAEPRLRHELALLRGGTSELPLPLTASRDEIFAQDSADEISAVGHGVSVAVISPDVAYRDCLQTTLRLAGFEIAPASCAAVTAAILWDVDPWDDLTAAELCAFCEERRHVPVIALMGFARPHEFAALQTCGAAAVVTKLASQADLIAALQSALVTAHRVHI